MKLGEQRLGGRAADELQDLVLASSDLEEFLGGLALQAAIWLARADRHVICAVAVTRPRKPATIGAGSPDVLELEQLQSQGGEGPGITAMAEKRTVYVRDLTRETRWPEFCQTAASGGHFAVLDIPIELDGELDGEGDGERRAVLSAYARRRSGFTAGDIVTAENVARQVSRPLRLALRIGRLQGARDDLASAMQSRTVIDMAIGVVMAQNRCGPDEAFTLLRKASNARNTKLRDVATSIVASIAGITDIQSRFEL
ncbi:GAF and ANTAR domain-containing protein [Arthrobacter sp. NicSoilB8]|uniref:GAF and ANTAR domain-containing protein n=1 Tax=Arthrobacter sp. NicSoilB8 TaxID=2830998 RepID=UPI001CC5CA7E|nr:GAF and ANTAR domain-containing protein [Arthrobacter sp. NicSoilB8]